VLWLLAVQITPHTARHPAFCHTSSRRRHELQPTILVSALTYPPMPTTSRPTYQAKPIAHTPCSGLVQNIFSLPARLIYVSGSACAYCRHAAKLKMLCIERGRWQLRRMRASGPDLTAMGIQSFRSPVSCWFEHCGTFAASKLKSSDDKGPPFCCSWVLVRTRGSCRSKAKTMPDSCATAA
jgi:hypothetical protein